MGHDMPGITKYCLFRSLLFQWGVFINKKQTNQSWWDILMWSSSKQNKNIKLWDVPEVMSFVNSFHYVVNFTGCGQSRKFQAWFNGKKASEFSFHFFGIFLDVIEIQKPQKVLIKIIHLTLALSESTFSERMCFSLWLAVCYIHNLSILLLFL